LFGAVAITALSLSTVAAAGDPEAGARAFRGCAACHSLAAGRHMTGPSLAGMWGRKAGTAEGFTRYSEAMVSSGVTWDAKTLDAWLENPAGFIPGNRMTFPGIADGKARADLIAYLEGAAAAEPPPGAPATAGGMANLRALGPEHQVTAIAHCGDTYRVTTAAGETIELWEFNLRFKTDSSELGPPAGRPSLLRSGMMGDRAFVVFASPEEIGAMIESKCRGDGRAPPPAPVEDKEKEPCEAL
jgi:cytochrome c